MIPIRPMPVQIGISLPDALVQSVQCQSQKLSRVFQSKTWITKHALDKNWMVQALDRSLRGYYSVHGDYKSPCGGAEGSTSPKPEGRDACRGSTGHLHQYTIVPERRGRFQS